MEEGWIEGFKRFFCKSGTNEAYRQPTASSAAGDWHGSAIPATAGALSPRFFLNSTKPATASVSPTNRDRLIVTQPRPTQTSEEAEIDDDFVELHSSNGVEPAHVPREDDTSTASKTAPERLAPIPLWGCLRDSTKAWTWRMTTSIIPGIEHPRFMSSQSHQSRCVVAAPCHDLPAHASPIEKVANGGQSIQEALAAIKAEFPRGKTSILMPIAQGNSYLFFFKRAHWVLAEMTMKDGLVKSVTLHDPKPGAGGYRGGHYIGAQVKAHNGTHKFTLTPHYVGHQRWSNHVTCGYFVSEYIGKRLEGRQPAALAPSLVIQLNTLSY